MRRIPFVRKAIGLAAAVSLLGLSAWAQSRAVPPAVEQQLRAKMRAESPPPAGLHLSQDGESYTYASASPDVTQGKPGAGGYQATLGRRLSGGIEVYAGQSDLSLKVWPVSDALFASPGVEKNGRLVYSGRGVRYEYEFKKNGVKEDIILESAPSEDLRLVFALRQNGNLDFRMDAHGNLLVYGPGALLSGFVQTGDDLSAERLLKARRNARKDHLMFLIPAPVIQDAAGKQYKDLAHYTLEGNALTLHTSDLSHLASPITIDPSIVVDTTEGFMTGNDEGMIRFDTDAISRAVSSGGSVGAWAATTSFALGRYNHTSVVYNGYVYVIGGVNGGFLNDVQFAPLNADGTVGSWTATTSLTAARGTHTSVAYNGYVYVIGGQGLSGNVLDLVEFAPVHADGTLGVWTATTAFTEARMWHASVAYNGYLYVIGGSGNVSAYLNDVQFAPFNSDGTVGPWTATTSFGGGRWGHTSVAYNGYLYVIGGYYGPSYYNTVQFAPIRSDGTLGT